MGAEKHPPHIWRYKVPWIAHTMTIYDVVSTYTTTMYVVISTYPMMCVERRQKQKPSSHEVTSAVSGT